MGNKYNCIRPGQVWLDTEGKRIQAHGGYVTYLDGAYYWYGEDHTYTDKAKDIWHWGMRCYRSTDLYNWEDLGYILPPAVLDPESPLHPSSNADRPHIIYNEKTKKFVCWLKIMEKDRTQSETVLTADCITGPYTLVRSKLYPFGMSGGDFDLATDTDGKAYYFFEKVHSEIICAELTEDYTDVSGVYSSHFPQSYPPFVREAPAHFERLGKHYLVTSGTSSYMPNPSELSVADSWHGPYKILGDPHPTDNSHTSFHSQISCVFKVPDKKDLYIACADRWIVGLGDTPYSVYEQAWSDLFSGKASPEQKSIASKLVGRLNAPVLSEADYVWLPFRFDGEMAYLDWHDEWRVEDYD